MMKFSEWKPGKVIAYERAMQKKKRRRGLAYQKKAWSIDLYDESFNFFILNVIIGQLTNN